MAIVFNLPEKVCEERTAAGGSQLRAACHSAAEIATAAVHSGLKREGFSHVFIFDTPEEVEAAMIERTPLWNDKRDDHGPFDIIGDLHGCYDELEALLSNSATDRSSWTEMIRSGATDPSGIPKGERPCSWAT